MPKTKTPAANTAAALARYPDLTIGGPVDVTPHHREIVPAGRAVLREVYETGNAVMVEFPGEGLHRRAYVWDTQITAAAPVPEFCSGCHVDHTPEVCGYRPENR